MKKHKLYFKYYFEILKCFKLNCKNKQTFSGKKIEQNNNKNVDEETNKQKHTNI